MVREPDYFAGTKRPKVFRCSFLAFSSYRSALVDTGCQGTRRRTRDWRKWQSSISSRVRARSAFLVTRLLCVLQLHSLRLGLQAFHAVFARFVCARLGSLYAACRPFSSGYARGAWACSSFCLSAGFSSIRLSICSAPILERCTVNMSRPFCSRHYCAIYVC